MPALESLPGVQVDAVELVTVELPLARPLVTAAGRRDHRSVLLVHVVAREAEGWAECPVEPEPTYAAEFTAAAALVLRDHLVPRAWSGPIGDALALGPVLAAVRGHHAARATLQLAVLDAQLRRAGHPLARWLGASASPVPPGAALGLHERPEELLAEADEALAAGAARLRVKVAPGRAAGHLAALRAYVGADVILQADANGSFEEDDAELDRLDEVGLACLEQPLDPEDLLGHARLAHRLVTPICLDESLTSVGAIEAAVSLGACEVACLKPARLGGWPATRAAVGRCIELGVPAWIGGMLETAVGRAANTAVAALPGLALPPDLDPRPRYAVDLAPPAALVDGGYPVPTEPGAGPHPDPERIAGADVVRLVGP